MGCNLTNSDAGKVVQFPGVGNSKNHTSQGLPLFFSGPSSIIDLTMLICMHGDLLPSAKTNRLSVQ